MSVFSFFMQNAEIRVGKGFHTLFPRSCLQYIHVPSSLQAPHVRLSLARVFRARIYNNGIK